MSQKILYFDCFAGICGDMTLGAMIDVGVPEGYLRSELGKLGLSGYDLSFTPGAKNGIHGTRADVRLEGMESQAHAPDHGHEHGHGHDHVHNHDGSHSHEHRTFKDIKALIESSSLSREIKELSLRIFGKLAEAEAHVHAQKAEDVHFHEVGAVDSIVDIVGAAICLDYLKPHRVLASRVELGGGFVKCQHGIIPVPAPAVVKLLEGKPVKSGAADCETTTPTGAAILAAVVDEFTDNKEFAIERIAYGVGHRDMEIPNLLRLFLGEGAAEKNGADAVKGASATHSPWETDKAAVLECNIDDMSPELHGHLFSLLLEGGASDVWMTPILMKKNRSAVTLSVLCRRERIEAIARLMFKETTSLGLRVRETDKFCLERREGVAKTSLGEVRVKTAYLGGERLRCKAEYEDLSRIAREKGLSLLEVQAKAQKEIDAE